MKHKHAELIHAWADGAEIQSRNDISGCWENNCLPMWAQDTMYRIKPEEKQPVVRWKWAAKRGNTWAELDLFATEEEGLGNKNLIKLEYTRTEFPE